MTPKKLKVGDRIRLVGVPGDGVPGYYIDRWTKIVYKKLVARKRSVRISYIDDDGIPWYVCKFRRKNGQWETHWLAVLDDDNNWQPVKRRV